MNYRLLTQSTLKQLFQFITTWILFFVDLAVIPIGNIKNVLTKVIAEIL